MARKKQTAEPIVTRGSHSTRTVYPDGRVEFETHWDELKRDVEEALASVANQMKPAVKAKTVKRKKKDVEA